MNLQLCVPHTPCPYACPHCVSNSDTDISTAINHSWWQNNQQEYCNRLCKVILSHDIKAIIITGTTEPTLPQLEPFVDFVHECLRGKELKIEIQTMNKNYIPKQGNDYQVLAYSHNWIPSEEEIKKIVLSRNTLSNDTLIRDVFILDHQMKAIEIMQWWNKMKEMGLSDQCTIKYMQLTSNGHKETDSYVTEHQSLISKEDMITLKNAGIWLDETCLDSLGRYFVFRSDGNLYTSWEFDSKMEI